jgi:hypothetical protein
MRNLRRFERRQEVTTRTVLDYFLLPENEAPTVHFVWIGFPLLIGDLACYRHFLRLVTMVDWYDEADN